MAQASSDSSTVAALRVLVADDSKALRQRARTMLERAGLTVVDEAADGAEAVSMAAAHQPDVVLLDPRMPRGDGLEVAQALRRQQPGMQVVLWAWDGAQLDRAARRSGAQAAVPKDIRAAELVATLQGVCGAQRDGGEAAPGARRRGRLARGRARAPAARPQPPVTPPPAVEQLAGAERAALERLGAANGYATSWPVGREVTRSLARRQLVLVASDYVLLTDAGRRALLSDRERGGRPPASGPG